MSGAAHFELVEGRIAHARKSGASNAFAYHAGFVLAPMSLSHAPLAPLFSRNGFSLFALLDRDHGRGESDARAWAMGEALRLGMEIPAGGEVWLLTQPRLFGFVFNPVSFWFFTDPAGALRAVLAEVNNTFGDRCAYLCRRADGGVIEAADTLGAEKIMAVSPFQRFHGRYRFRFDWRADRISVWIGFEDDKGGGMIATLGGARRRMSAVLLLASLIRWPLGSLQGAALISWQALKLRLKGERYRPRPRTKGTA
jgi:DUF1365 family protein